MSNQFQCYLYNIIYLYLVIQYFETIWMGTPNRPALFEALCWNQYDVGLAGLPRSSNSFRALLGFTNPIMWSFLTALKLEQRLTSTTAWCQMDPTRREPGGLHDCLGQWRIQSSKIPLCCFCCYLRFCLLLCE